MSTNRDVEFPDVFSHDELAANLMKCAMLVKKGEKDPLIRQTIHDLTYYLTGRRVGEGSMSHSNSNSQVAVQLSPTSGSVTKHSHKTLTGVLGKLVGLTHDEHPTSAPTRSDSEKAATSFKNAERARAELSSRGVAGSSSTASHQQEWCDVHFTMGCQCKNRKTAAAVSRKPPFQRPSNPSSTLIANGWIEQQRRSKMRTVWKEVLASLVEGRKAGEETTLWIQREVTNPSTGKTELEALHQIPLKWLQEVTYSNYSTDHRFVIKVYNLQEEFVFRCESSEEAAQNWVLTLRSMQEMVQQKNGRKPVKTGLDDWDELPNKSSSFEDEKKVPEQSAQSHRVAHTTPQAAHAAQQSAAQQSAVQQSAAQQAAAQQAAAQHAAAQHAAAQQSAAASQQQHSTVHRMTVHELRAIAHGAGIVTYGMERGELEHVVQQISAAASGVASGPPPTTSRAPPPPPASTGSTTPSPPSSAQNLSSSASPVDDARRKQAEEPQLAEEFAHRKKLAEEAARSRAAADAQQKKEEENRRVVAEQLLRQQQEAEKRKKDEEERQRLELERQRREEEEHRRRVAELQAAEQRRRLEEQQRQQQAQWQQQQQNWQKQQAEDELRRRAEEQKAAEERRRRDEAYRAQHQQWQQQRPQAASVPPQQWQQQPRQQNLQNPQYGPKPQPPPFVPGHAPPHPGAVHPPPPHPGTGHPPPPPPGGSPVNMKYAKMAAQTVDVGQMSLQAIKHGILVEWALQQPAMQILRPIEVLVTSIHTVFPPKFGVAGHEHFTKWTVVTMPEVLSGAQPDDEKLKKVVKKLRFFLHPDKLPRDFSEEQTFMCKMLWDITTDAFEDHKKKEEELGWMR